MQKVRLTEEGLWGAKITEDDIYNMYTTEEVLSMTDVSEKEKQDVIMIFHEGDVVGWVEDTESSEDSKIFIQIYDEHILEEVK